MISIRMKNEIKMMNSYFALANTSQKKKISILFVYSFILKLKEITKSAINGMR